MTPSDTIDEISPAIGTLGSLYYFHPDTLARGSELGLDGLRFYILGRGGVLGDVEADVVRAGFGYFEPSLITKMWTSACAILAPREAAREHLACNAAIGRTGLAEVEGLGAFCEAAETLVDSVDESGLSLFAGFRAEPRPDDVAARALHLAVVLRELRGSAHLVAVRAVGLESKVAHAISRPEMVEMFGWSEPIETTDADRASLERAEKITNEILLAPFSELDSSQLAALAAGTAAMSQALVTT
jgi:hypothetical protein